MMNNYKTNTKQKAFPVEEGHIFYDTKNTLSLPVGNASWYPLYFLLPA
jgi:hypothetical protein